MAEFFSAPFWDSNFLTSLVTFAVGFVALIIYKKQATDKKKDAANIVLLEIKKAEENLTQAREVIVRDKVLPESTFAMKTSSWSKYSYLFVREFTDEEWNLINTFYEKCRLYDKAVEYNNTFFMKNEEQIRINLQQALAEYTKSYLKKVGEAFEISDPKARAKQNKEDAEDYKSILDGFHESFMAGQTEGKNGYFYRPNKAFQDGEAIIDTIRLDLSTSTLGIKLKNIVDQNFRSRLFGFLSGSKKP